VPRLDGKKVGVFATRTPHRPLPIGLTVAKVCTHSLLELALEHLVGGAGQFKRIWCKFLITSVRLIAKALFSHWPRSFLSPM
jgi:hypothetical protein